MDVDKGMIEKVNLSGSILDHEKLEELETSLLGLYHKPDQILEAWEKIAGNSLFSQTEIHSILSTFF